MLNEEQKKEIHDAGESNSYESLGDDAVDFIDNEYPNMSETDKLEAIDIFITGFFSKVKKGE